MSFGRYYQEAVGGTISRQDSMASAKDEEKRRELAMHAYEAELWRGEEAAQVAYDRAMSGNYSLMQQHKLFQEAHMNHMAAKRQGLA